MARGLSYLAAALALLALAAGAAVAAPPGPAPVAREVDAGRLTFPTGLAVAPDGSVWIASTQADRLVRFDPATSRRSEVVLPLRSHPAGLLVDDRGGLWYAASGLGLVGRIEGNGKPKEFPVPAMDRVRADIASPRALALDRRAGEVWFTVQSDGLVGRLPRDAAPRRRGFAVTEISLGPPTVRPEGIAADGRGGVWVAELGADRFAYVTAAGVARRVALAPGSRPRAVAIGPDGAVWATLFGAHRLLRLDPATLQTAEWPMPSAPRSSPLAIAVDGTGAVWVSELEGNAVARFDPRAERFTAVPLPTPRSGVRALAVAPDGRVWFVGSWSGRLGVIE